MGFPLIGDLIKTVGGLIDDLHTSGEEKNTHVIEKLKLVQQQLLGQQAITEAEAKHPSVFVAGARPFIIWVSGFGIAYQFILYPLLLWIWAIAGQDMASAPPPIDATTLMTMVLSMLGVGTMRSFDKKNNTDTKDFDITWYKKEKIKKKK